MISGGSVLSMLLHHPVPVVLGESSELPSLLNNKQEKKFRYIHILFSKSNDHSHSTIYLHTHCIASIIEHLHHQLIMQTAIRQ